MGLSSKQVSGEGFDWAKNIMQAGALELPNIVTPVRQQQQQQQQQQSVPPLKCPRCESTNTKFCYYNNYNRSQPRHFCKSCRRHWTKGGTLRNVPVGGGRKNKRLKTSHSSSTNTTNKDINTSQGSKITKGSIQSQEQVHQQQLPLEYNDQKKFSEILYQSLLQPTSSLLPTSHHLDYINNNLLVSTLPMDSLLPLPNHPSTTLSSFSTNPSSMLSSFDARFQFPNVLNYTDEGKPSDNLTTITTTTATTMTPPVQWQVPAATNGVMDSPNFWNWEDLNTFN
ncbi:hypothetical protein AQUCO_07800053v1 [Aquilegia coerulea]|uniref:Dof zinc finger protein n=1 Tax=Aquilegia coerulea TaxID=218851 RepID=A0A2G5C9B6_AQUCA|nr:hypothetical protein AQUCO_07800053v1 [Aquilegia coerulea]